MGKIGFPSPRWRERERGGRKKRQRTDGDSISIRRPLAQKLDRPGELASEIKLVNRDAMFRLVSKNKRVSRSKRNCLLFILCGLAGSRVSAAMERGELRARNEFRAKNGGREKKAKGRAAKRGRRRRRERLVSGRAIYRSAARVKEAWKSVSRERTRSEKVGRITEIHGVFYFRPSNDTVGATFSSSFTSALRVEGSTSRNRGRLSCEIKNALDSRR